MLILYNINFTEGQINNYDRTNVISGMYNSLHKRYMRKRIN